MNDNPTNAEEQFELGEQYRSGEGVRKNLKKAFFWYDKAAQQGKAVAMKYLGWCYEFGHGTRKDTEKAAYWYSQALSQYTIEAEKGDAEAQYVVASMNRSNYTGIRTDANKAFLWYNKAAEQGHEEAQRALGRCYEHGTIVPKNMEKANYWYAKASEQYKTKTQYYKSGINYYNGTGVPKDVEKARHYLTLAGEQGQAALKRIKAGKSPEKSKGIGCYVATCVYGSYDCPQVRTLRRYRDARLSKSWFGRLFIKGYYVVSPKIVELFGNTKWFNGLFKPVIDKIVCSLQNSGIDSSHYSDI